MICFPDLVCSFQHPAALSLGKTSSKPFIIQPASFVIWYIFDTFCPTGWFNSIESFWNLIFETDLLVVFCSTIFFLQNYWWLCHRIFLAKEICPFHSLCMDLVWKSLHWWRFWAKNIFFLWLLLALPNFGCFWPKTFSFCNNYSHFQIQCYCVSL